MDGESLTSPARPRRGLPWGPGPRTVQLACALLLGAALGACRPAPTPEWLPKLPPEIEDAGAESHLLRPAPAAPEQDASADMPPGEAAVDPRVDDAPGAVRGARYSLQLRDVPVRELLFGLARDSGLGLDLHPGVDGRLSLSAHEQPLPVLLERVAALASIRCELRDGRIWAAPDAPYLRIYRVGYPYLRRETSAEIRVASEISAAAVGTAEGSTGDGNNSLSSVHQISVHDFWETLEGRLDGFLKAQAYGREEEFSISVDPLSGLLAVRARKRDHDVLSVYLEELLAALRRQVLIRVTILELRRVRRRDTGLDLRLEDPGAGLDVELLDLGATGDLLGSYLLRYQDPDAGGDALQVTLRLLRELGEVRVLSSPRLMVLNNQTALLKVVDNLVYFTVEQQSTLSVQGSSSTISSSSAHTVPVGIVMSVTPQIDADGSVQFSIRPSVSRVNRYVPDPNPALREAGNRVPEIQVREMESVLRLRDGEVALLGGLSQDRGEAREQGPAGLERVPLLGRLLGSRKRLREHSELLILISSRLHPPAAASATGAGDS